MRKPKPTERDRKEQGLAFLGFIDRMSARHFLREGQIETWERDCKCEDECNCWELSGRRPATQTEGEMFRAAQAPWGTR